MRTLVEHADTRVQLRTETPFRVEFPRDEDLRGELRLLVGDDVIDLKATAQAVIELAHVIDQHIVDGLSE
jgi:hypothetical protein